jgi:hypothetical protein
VHATERRQEAVVVCGEGRGWRRRSAPSRTRGPGGKGGARGRGEAQARGAPGEMASGPAIRSAGGGFMGAGARCARGGGVGSGVVAWYCAAYVKDIAVIGE